MNSLKVFIMDGCYHCVALEKYLKDNQIKYDLYNIKNKKTIELAKKFNVRAYPTFFIVKDNTILHAQAGFDIHNGDMRALLKEKGVS